MLSMTDEGGAFVVYVKYFLNKKKTRTPLGVRVFGWPAIFYFACQPIEAELFMHCSVSSRPISLAES